MARHWVWLTVIALVTTGCGGTSSRTSHHEARDSAGVSIVEYDRLPPEPAHTLLPEDPDLRIGAPDETGALFDVRAASVLHDGRIAVANNGSGQILLFGSSGIFEASAGRRGFGPGEFRVITAVSAAPGDSIVAFDPSLRRVSYFDAEGDFARSYSVAGGPAPAAGVLKAGGWLADGSFVVVEHHVPVERDPGGPDGIIRYRTSATLLVLAPDGTTVASLDGLSGDESVIGVSSVDGGGLRIRTVRSPDLHSLRVTARGEAIVSGVTDSYALTLRSAAAEPVMLLRVRSEALNGSTLIDGAQAQSTVVDVHPKFGRVLLSPRGDLWVEEGAGDEDAHSWATFGPDGEWRGRIAAPEGLEVIEVGAEHVLGLHRDELGVEWLHLYSLEPAS